jgi:hypothetical protein
MLNLDSDFNYTIYNGVKVHKWLKYLTLSNIVVDTNEKKDELNKILDPYTLMIPYFIDKVKNADELFALDTDNFIYIKEAYFPSGELNIFYLFDTLKIKAFQQSRKPSDIDIVGEFYSERDKTINLMHLGFGVDSFIHAEGESTTFTASFNELRG